jgi:4-diphosphocytidyl-2-C-methyl-D-erythritol kinase
LVQMWNLPHSEVELFTLAEEIGSDVPFFLKGGTALATGKGQQLEYLDADWEDVTFVVIYPKIEVSSAWAYKSLKLNLTQKGKYVNLKGLFNKWTFSLNGRMDLVMNDLEEGVSCRYPVIGAAKEALLSEGAVAAAMTGSGSAVYGIFGKREEARKAAQRIQQPRWDVFLTKPINLCRGGVGRGDH